jgi:hemerythrin superfamily protein
MDAIQLLTEDHRRVDQLFERFQQASRAQEKREIAELIFKELTVHGMLEKETFYPAAAQKGTAAEKELIEHSYHDHGNVEQLMGELRLMTATDERYVAKFMELMHQVQEHAQEEEQRMFPDARKHLGDDLDRLGRELERRQRELMAAPV